MEAKKAKKLQSLHDRAVRAAQRYEVAPDATGTKHSRYDAWARAEKIFSDALGIPPHDR